MDITVSIPALLRPLTRDCGQIVGHGYTVGELIENLDACYPGIGPGLMAGGAVHGFINLYVNDDDIRFAAGLATPLHAGDHVTILPAVAGG